MVAARARSPRKGKISTEKALDEDNGFVRRSALLGFFKSLRLRLRDGLRREELFLGIITADLKVCSTPFRLTVWSLRAAFWLIFCLT
jgi:hypothetical protein